MVLEVLVTIRTLLETVQTKNLQVSCATVLFVILAQHDDKIHVPGKKISQILTLCHIYFLQYIRVESHI